LGFTLKISIRHALSGAAFFFAGEFNGNLEFSSAKAQDSSSTKDLGLTCVTPGVIPKDPMVKQTGLEGSWTEGRPGGENDYPTGGDIAIE